MSDNLNRYPIYRRTREFNSLIISFVRNMPTDMKHLVGQKIVDSSISLLNLVIRANLSEDLRLKLNLIKECKNKLYLINTTCYFCCEQKVISVKAYTNFTILSNDIDRQLNGWEKSTLSKLGLMVS